MEAVQGSVVGESVYRSSTGNREPNREAGDSFPAILQRFCGCVAWAKVSVASHRYSWRVKPDKPASTRPLSLNKPAASASRSAALSGFDELELHPLVLRGIAKLGYTAPTDIQGVFIPVARSGQDAIGLAPTGTGKTLAYGIPIADVLLRDKPADTARRRPDPAQRLRAIVVVPTRELAQQVGKEIQELVKGSLLRVVSVFGKVALAPQRDAVKSGVDDHTRVSEVHRHRRSGSHARYGLPSASGMDARTNAARSAETYALCHASSRSGIARRAHAA